MRFGHNSNVTIGEVLYHVQTEDRGATHALIDTTGYYGGRVADLADQRNHASLEPRSGRASMAQRSTRNFQRTAEHKARRKSNSICRNWRAEIARWSSRQNAARLGGSCDFNCARSPGFPRDKENGNSDNDFCE